MLKRSFYILALAMSHMALLVHVLIPHHHHEQFSCLEISTCSADQHNASNPIHQVADPQDCSADPSCLSLKNALYAKIIKLGGMDVSEGGDNSDRVSSLHWSLFGPSDVRCQWEVGFFVLTPVSPPDAFKILTRACTNTHGKRGPPVFVA